MGHGTLFAEEMTEEIQPLVPDKPPYQDGEFLSAIQGYWKTLDPWRLDFIIDKYLTPIARHWAWEISICAEDLEDAQQVLLVHMSEALKPASMRRARASSPIRKAPVAGYSVTSGSPYGYFWETAEKKAFDILKGRRRRWKRDCIVREGLEQQGESYYDPRAFD